MPKKLTTEEFIIRAQKAHGNKYDYSKVNYINIRTKIIITCPEHGDFFQTPNSHMSGHGCPVCGKISMANAIKLDQAEFEKRANIIHNNKYDYSKTKYINSKTKIIIICPIHGKFYQTADAHLQGSGCKKCGILSAANSLKYNSKIFIKKAIKIFGNKYDYSQVNYVNSHTKVTIICPIHGAFLQKPNAHLGGQGCIKCGILSNTTDLHDFKNKASIIHNNKYDYSKANYINCYTKIIIICPIHGEFSQTPNGHLSGNGCRLCKSCISKPEKQWLELLHIPDDRRCRNAQLKIDKKIYRPDGIIKTTNTIYEFWGDFYHGNPKKFNKDDINPVTKCTYGELYNKTIKKIETFKKAGYNVIDIWESEFKEMMKVKQTRKVLKSKQTKLP